MYQSHQTGKRLIGDTTNESGPGPYIMAETINEGIPPWVFTHYPQVAFISQDEKGQNITSDGYCPLSLSLITCVLAG